MPQRLLRALVRSCHHHLVFPRFISISSTSSFPQQQCEEIVDCYLKILKQSTRESNLESLLQKARGKVSSSCIFKVLSKCDESNRLWGLRFFIWAGQQPYYRHSRLMYQRACQILCLGQEPDLLLNVLEAYKKSGYVVSVRTFKEFLNICKEENLPEHALLLLRRMPEFNCRADTVLYNIVIHLFCSKDISVMADLVREMSLHGLHPNMSTYIALIRGLCDQERLDDARNLLKNMKPCGCSPNIVVYSVLIDAMCKAGRVDMATELLDDMHREQCLPNAVVYTSLIQNFCARHQIQEALDLFDRMILDGCLPNKVSIHLLFKGLCANGRSGDALKLLEQLVRSQNLPTGECYSLLFVSLVTNNCLSEAEELLDKMLARNIKPSTSACGQLIRRLCLNDRSLDAFELYSKMAKESFCVDTDILYEVLASLYKQNHLAEAATLTKMMINKGIEIKEPYQPNTCIHQ